VSLIIVTDNTPNTDNKELFASNDKVAYYPNKANFGLSRAFNRCLKNELVKKSDFIVFLDQDSSVQENTVEILINDFLALRKIAQNVGCIGPFYYEENIGEIVSPKGRREILKNIYKVKNIITSAMLTTYANLELINFWNEKIFLDFADWDLCWRFREAKLCCCITANTILHHKLGNRMRQLGPFVIREAAPIREYYQMRDGLKLLVKTYTPGKFKILFLFNLFIRPVIHILFLPDKEERVKYMVSGFFDFLAAKNGSFFYIADYRTLC
jgi:rhamnosyltransferase